MAARYSETPSERHYIIQAISLVAVVCFGVQILHKLFSDS